MTAIRCSTALDKPVVFADGVRPEVALVAADVTAKVVAAFVADVMATAAVVTSCCDVANA
jgi:hypothetical protein